MKLSDRAKLISLLSKELEESVGRYEKAKGSKAWVWSGDGLDIYDSKTALARRIVTIREELMQLSKNL